MQWENLTVPEFAAAVARCQGVGLLGVGVIEPHARHLPLGEDAFVAHWLACEVAKLEPAIVFPFFPWGINHEAQHLAGAVVLRRELVFQMLEAVCDEMGRNGLKKIVLINGHGGNRYLLGLFVQTLVEKRRPYTVYFAQTPHMPGLAEVVEEQENGHACEAETSMALAVHPQLVKMDAIPPRPFRRLPRAKALADAGVYGPMDWYACYPTMYVGDARKATAAKGEHILRRRIEMLVKAVRAIKADAMTPALLDRFMAQTAAPRPPPADLSAEPIPGQE